jgi:malonyl-CoA O-methyltransferase
MNRLRRWRRGRSAPLPTLASKDAYALWAASYPPEAHNPLMRLEQDAMLRLMPSLAGRAVLDMACGSGRYGRIAGAAGASRTVGIDSSLDMLHASDQPRALAEMDAAPFAAGSFDVILCGLATGHLPPDRMRAALREMSRLLRGGGVLLLSDFHPFMVFSGGQRTFTASDGARYAVEHYPHLVADYFNAATAAGLRLDAIDEARAPGMEAPAVLVLRLVR